MAYADLNDNQLEPMGAMQEILDEKEWIAENLNWEDEFINNLNKKDE